MKHLIITSLSSLLILAACSTSPKPEEITLPEEPSGHVALPSEEMAKRTGYSLKQLHIGFGVYLRKCGECHIHVLPEQISSEDWHVATPKMAWNANITDSEQAALLKYILAAKGEIGPKNLHLEHVNPELRKE